MAADAEIVVYVGFDARESVASEVCKHSILKRTKSKTNVRFLKHRELRASGVFTRTWVTVGATGEWMDAVDGKPFSTEFSHTRFLVPHLMKYKGWALFMDSDMIFLSDIKKLFDLCNDKYAVMCVKHKHKPQLGAVKMDGREQLGYYRKNWSSFVLWNCAHPSNAGVTAERVSMMKGADLHAFKWLPDELIGELPTSYNYISGVSPHVHGATPDVIHYTEGGPWFTETPDVPYGDLWLDEYANWQENSSYNFVSSVPASMERERRYKPVEEYRLSETSAAEILEIEISKMEQEE